MKALYIILAIIFGIAAFYLALIAFSWEQEKNRFYSRNQLPWLLLVGNVGYFAIYFFCEAHNIGLVPDDDVLDIPTTTICIIDCVILFAYILTKGLIARNNSNKISRAIDNGIIGTIYAYEGEEKKILTIKRHQFEFEYIDSYSYKQKGRSKYYGILDLYDNETRKFIRSVAEEELLDMLKDGTKYRVLNPIYRCDTWYFGKKYDVFDNLMKTRKCPFCGKPASEISYKYINKPQSHETELMIYTECCKDSSTFINQLIEETKNIPSYEEDNI